MSQFAGKIKETLGLTKVELPWTKENLPKQLFINNEVILPNLTYVLASTVLSVDRHD